MISRGAPTMKATVSVADDIQRSRKVAIDSYTSRSHAKPLVAYGVVTSILSQRLRGGANKAIPELSHVSFNDDFKCDPVRKHEHFKYL